MFTRKISSRAPRAGARAAPETRLRAAPRETRDKATKPSSTNRLRFTQTTRSLAQKERVIGDTSIETGDMPMRMRRKQIIFPTAYNYASNTDGRRPAPAVATTSQI